jgi:glycerol-1-phosphate dehydrogenase [NAD(P)+]
MKNVVYHKNTFLCSCGKVHENPIDEIVIGAGAIKELSTAPTRLHLGRNVLLVTDEIIMGIMGHAIVEQLEAAACTVKVLAYPLPVLPDEKHIFEFLCNATKDIDFFVTVGSGSVNDITRFLSSRMGKPYISVPTAPSMDGYSAKVSLLFVDGVKQTLDAIYPKAIYADTDYLVNAPQKLLAAGVGDLAAKITACTDWKISGIVNGEYYCQQSIDELMEIVDKSLETSPGLAKNEEAAVQFLTSGLLLSGIVMHWVDSSRPAAGAEHHITHFWGMQSGKPQHLHGIEVAVGTLIMLRTYQALLKVDFSKVDAARIAADMPDESTWRKTIKELCGDQAHVIYEQQKDKTFDQEMIRKRIERIITHEQEIKQVIRDAIEYVEPLDDALKTLGAPTTARELGISPENLRISFLWAKEMRAKYGVLDLAYDLGVLDQISDIVL